MVFASDIGNSLGRDLVNRSLNKRITVTPRRSWTEHTGTNSGIDRNIVTCSPPIYPRKDRERYEYTPTLRGSRTTAYGKNGNYSRTEQYCN